jgi:hypothetical protein
LTTHLSNLQAAMQSSNDWRNFDAGKRIWNAENKN